MKEKCIHTIRSSNLFIFRWLGMKRTLYEFSSERQEKVLFTTWEGKEGICEYCNKELRSKRY